MKHTNIYKLIILGLIFFTITSCGILFPHTAVFAIKSSSLLPVSYAGETYETNFKDLFIESGESTSTKINITQSDKYYPLAFSWYGNDEIKAIIKGKITYSDQESEEMTILSITSVKGNENITVNINQASSTGTNIEFSASVSKE